MSKQWAAAAAAGALVFAGCTTVNTTHPIVPSELGASSRTSVMAQSLERPGTVRFQRVLFAEWTGGRGGFINRDDPRTASVPPGDEQAEIYAYVIDHPTQGLWLIDTGASAALPERVGPAMRAALRQIPITLHSTTADWLRSGDTAPRGVMLTHLHFDHIGGLIDLNPATPVYLGPGDARDRHWANVPLGRPTDRILRGYGPLREWAFQPDPDGGFAAVIDVFGDGSVWALHVPGHTPGSTAYLVNAVNGPKLVVGDAANVRLIWQDGMPQPLAPEDQAVAALSLSRLHALVEAHPQIEVFLGHQSRTGQTAAVTPRATYRQEKR